MRALCAVATEYCLEPHGWLTGTGYWVNNGARLPKCGQCRQPVCIACSTPVGRTVHCLDCQVKNVKVAGLI